MKMRMTYLCLCLLLLHTVVFTPRPVLANAAPSKGTAVQTWPQTDYRYILVVYFLLFQWALGRCTVNAPADFLAEYDRDLARLCGPDVHLVKRIPATPTTGGTGCTLTCRRAVSARAFDLRITLRYGAAGQVETLTFDRDLILPGGAACQADQPVPIETIMRAIRRNRRMPSVMAPEILTVKSCSTSTSLKKPEASGFKGMKKVAGNAPTSFQNFTAGQTFVVGLNVTGYTNPTYHTFPCVADAITGKNGDKYSSKFYLDNDTELKNKVALFTAQIRNGQVSFVYKEWLINPHGEFIDQATYDKGRQNFADAKPGRYLGTAIVTFSMGSEAHVASDVPMRLGVSKYAAAARSVKAKPARRAGHLAGANSEI